MSKLISISVLTLGYLLQCGCGDSGSDTDVPETLDRLRVLAVRSTPADIAPGETATLDALVYAPDEQEVSYSWSWCPSRADDTGNAGATSAFECAIDEKRFRKAWESAGIDAELPGYDLGSEAEASFLHVLTAERLAAVCAELAAKEADPELGALSCLYGLKPSLELKVQTASARLTALRTLPLLYQESDPEQRNANPELGKGVELVKMGSGIALGRKESLVAGGKYTITAEVDPDTSQSFVPQPAGLTSDMGPMRGPMLAPEPHQEALTLGWYVTLGKLIAPNGESGGFGGGDSTSFVPGVNSIESLLKTGWQLPLTAKNQEVQLVLVLRDERGGVNWARHYLNVSERQ